MADERCILHTDRDCIGLKRAEEVANDVKNLDRRLNEFQQRVSETHNKFGGRIGKLEARNEVQDEQVNHIKEALSEVKSEIRSFQTEQKNSIAELRAENKESMSEIKHNHKELMNIVTPMMHKMEDVNELKKEVDEIKSKSGKTWESIKEKGLNWAIMLILAILAAALGLSRFL